MRIRRQTENPNHNSRGSYRPRRLHKTSNEKCHAKLLTSLQYDPESHQQGPKLLGHPSAMQQEIRLATTLLLPQSDAKRRCARENITAGRYKHPSDLSFKFNNHQKQDQRMRG